MTHPSVTGCGPQGAGVYVHNLFGISGLLGIVIQHRAVHKRRASSRPLAANTHSQMLGNGASVVKGIRQVPDLLLLYILYQRELQAVLMLG